MTSGHGNSLLLYWVVGRSASSSFLNTVQAVLILQHNSEYSKMNFLSFILEDLHLSISSV